MPSKRIGLFHDFDQRLWLRGGRDQIPNNALRRAVGVAPELTGSVRSRWGSELIANVNAISLYRWNGHRYQYDGTNLFKDGVFVTGGFDGSKLRFINMPPQEGLSDYLFILGGGQAIKIDTAGNVTKWGIDAPANGMTASVLAQDTLVIDTFVTSSANWSPVNCTVANDTSDPYVGAGDLKVHPTAGPWRITRTVSLDMSQYADSVFSLLTDWITLFVQFRDPTKIIWLWIMFDIGDGSFKQDYYKLVVQLVPTTTNPHTAGANIIISPNADEWTQIGAAKSDFTRIGTNLALDWSNVNKVRIEGGDPGDISDGTNNLFLNYFSMFGGYPLGAGPTASQNILVRPGTTPPTNPFPPGTIAPLPPIALLTGGGGTSYQYAVTFGSSLTDSDSNPNGMVILNDGSVSPFSPVTVPGVSLQPVQLSNIPVSADPQVNLRKVWRTTGQTISGVSTPLFYLDTIPDNTTTTYKDVKADISYPLVVTPWTATTAMALNKRIDGGNGFWFFVSARNTDFKTAATIPNWNIPSGPFLGDWNPALTYLPGEWVNYLGTGYLSLTQNLNSRPSTHPADWQVLGTTTDNHVTWAWGGLNSVPFLGNQQLLFDNQAPQPTYKDVAGPFQGSLFWCGDTTQSRRGWVYMSPPGRPESVGSFAAITADDDPTQKVIIWDNVLWLLTTLRAWQLTANYPALSGIPVKDSGGTITPFAVIAGQHGIIYQSQDSIRVLDWAGTQLAGFDNIAPILRGQGVENVAAFSATWCELTREEILFGDNTTTFGLSIQNGQWVWRIIGLSMLAAFYEHDTGQIQSSFLTKTWLFEESPLSTDDIHLIPFEIQTQSALVDEGQVCLVQRLYIDIDPGASGNNIVPTLVIDNATVALATLPTGTGRKTFEIPIQRYGRLVALNLFAALNNRIEFFGLEADVSPGTGA